MFADIFVNVLPAFRDMQHHVKYLKYFVLANIDFYPWNIFR